MRVGITDLLSTLSLFIIPIICGLISRGISKGRGMHGGFWWGFFLLIIGIIVVAVRPNDKQTASDSETRNVIIEDTQSFISDTESIKRYKELLDCGAITQEEYDAKKKQLLGL